MLTKNAVTTLTISESGNEKAVQVSEEEIISFPEGLVGCESWRRFVLLADPENDAVSLLQDVDHPAISFLVTDPTLICPDYDFELGTADGKMIGLEDQRDVVVLCILVVRDNPLRITANLLGPLVINRRTRLGRQIVLADSSYSARHPVIFPAEEARQC